MSLNEGSYLGVGENKATFTVNGKVHVVSDNVPAHTTLNTYIRDYAHLKGTKFMCKEGGCGACVVTISYEHPVTKKLCTKAVNSCLFPVFACHGVAVTTVEGIGNKKVGYDKVQSRLAHFNGTQCGYCSPGMVMSMYSMLKDNSSLTMQEVETALDGNICRCTGYRPILDTYKSFTTNASDELQRKVADIEDLLKVCPKSRIQCHGKCEKAKCDREPFDCVEKEEEDELYESKFIELALASPTLSLKLQTNGIWCKVTTVKEIFEIFEMTGGSYQLVGGNTARGVYKYEKRPDVYIDINNVVELKGHTFDGTCLCLGANMTLTEAIQLFSAVAQERPGIFGYAQVIANHIKRVANTPVRNIGTLAGNLSIKHKYREFPSDIFLTLETVGATVTIHNGLTEETMPLLQYFEIDMNKKVMTKINLLPLDHMCVVKTYKITPRSLNSKAYVNAGFCFKLDRYNRFRVLEIPNIVYGGINTTFGHASRTENYLRDKCLMDLPALQGALLILSQEVKPDNKPPEASPEYRLGLVLSLFYKFVLSLFPDSVNPKYRSGGENLIRPLSSGKQDFETDPSMFPLGKPMPKLEALIQCSGEAEYTQDIPICKDTLFAALALAPHGPGTIDSIDASTALKVHGVVAFFSAKDIPGKNTFTAPHLVVTEFEELFASRKVVYAGQPVGVVIAETQEIADESVKLVTVKYLEKQKPLLDVRDVLKSGEQSRIILTGSIKPTASKHDVKHKVNGSVALGGQYHFTMETHCCLSIPTDDGLEVFAATQWIMTAQEAIALCLNIPENKITMRVKRIGGGYGCKLTRSNQPITVCTLAAYLLQKPVRIVLPIETHMKSTGGRYPNYTEYEVGVDDKGVIQYLMANIYENSGVALNDPVVPILLIPTFPLIYDSSTWTVNGYDVRTDRATSSWMRAPGSLEAAGIIEHIMEHIAVCVNMDPLEVKLNNTIPGQYPIADMISYIKVQSDYHNRLKAIKSFNKTNVWKKRGIAFLPTRYPLEFLARYHATVSIYRQDGTVAITHGGIELGQGINTKAAQACAYTLGIDMENIIVKPSNNITAPDSEFTGNSLTTESVVLAVIKCCNILLERLEPVRKQMTNPTWKEVIKKAYDLYVNLFACEMMSPPSDKLVRYNVFGVGVIEVEIDVLTGEYQILRADVLEDAGRSFNPTLDIGQVEGAFVMGLGYFTSEELKYDQQTGWLLTDRTWHYKVPLATDIPIDFRVYIKKNGDNPLGILRTKAVGEPPILLSCAVMSALRHAITSARTDLGYNDWFELNAPITRENVFLTVKSGRNNYVL